MSRAVAFAFGALLAVNAGYLAWKAVAANDPRLQGRAAVRDARRAARAVTQELRHAVHDI